MDPGEQTTGTRDEHYNLVSVLYHALHGADNCDIYALDAEAGGRTDLYEFFREAQVTQAELAERAKELLGIGVAPGGVPPETGVEPQPPPEGGLPPEASPEAGVPPDTAPGEVRREPPLDAPMPEEDVAEPEVPPDVPPPHIPAPPPPPDEEPPR